jgi:hypothetical protein
MLGGLFSAALAEISGWQEMVFQDEPGTRFEAVPVLEVEYQYQCAFPWRGRLYLGTGGWTVNRTAKNQARIYRFDGKKREQVLADIQLNGITSLVACGRHLYALADSGWETPVGSAALYRNGQLQDDRRPLTLFPFDRKGAVEDQGPFAHSHQSE